VKNDAFRSPFPAHADGHQRACGALILAGRRVGTHEDQIVPCKELLILGFEDLQEVVTVGLSAKVDATVAAGHVQRPHAGPLTGRNTSLIHHQGRDFIDSNIIDVFNAEGVGISHFEKPFTLVTYPT
jgi:hypothetical protein